jgi:hypothetical protein
MAEPKLRRRGHGEDAIYFAASKNRYVGAVSLGFTPDGKRIRRKVSGKTKQEDPGTSPALRRGTPGASEAPDEGPPAGGGPVAGPRPGLLFQNRHAAEREQRDPLIPEDH